MTDHAPPDWRINRLMHHPVDAQPHAAATCVAMAQGYDARTLRHNTQKYIGIRTGFMPALDYQTAFHLAPIGLVLSRSRMIEDCNDELASIFGCAREALIGQSFQVLYPSADEFERIGARIPPIMTAHGSYADDRIMKRANGELFWCHVTGRSLERADPHAAGVWTFEDLSATRRVAVELTPREREIAAQLVTGKTSKQIGRILDISSRTVDVYRARLMRKYDTGNATELLQRLLGH
jgi:PAS domain S-box-containing protein